MSRFTGSNRLRHLWTVVLPAVLFFCTATFGADKTTGPSGPKYDLQTETKVKVTIDDVILPPKGSEKLPVHLRVKAGNDVIDVYVCPKSFLDDMGITFAKGEEIVLTGSKVKDGDADLVLAREIVKGTDTVVLRDDKGKPVWS